MRITVAASLVIAMLLAGCARVPGRATAAADAEAAAAHDATLRRFASQAELSAWLVDVDSRNRERSRLETEHHERLYARERERCAATPPPAGCDHVDGDGTTIDTVTVTGSRIKRADISGASPLTTITNNQEAGVDEGDIVKMSGDFVYVLSQGVLYVVRVTDGGRDALSLTDRLPVGDTDRDAPGGVWFDEILALGDRLILLGYRYSDDAQSTELRAFRVGADGRLRRDGVWWLRSRDYYSGAGYGVRLHDGHLLMSVALALPLTGTQQMPWPEWSRRDVATPTWTPLLEASDLYYPVYPSATPVAHVVLRCPLSGLDGPGLDCRADGFIGDGDSTLYATPAATWLAVAGSVAEAISSVDLATLRDFEGLGLRSDARRRTAVIRLPHDGSAPTFATVRGRVDDPFHFDEDGDRLWLATQTATADRRADGSYRDYGTHLRLYRLDAADLHSRRGDEALPRREAEFAGDVNQLRFGAGGLWIASDPGAGARLQLLPRGDAPVATFAADVDPDTLQPIAGRLLAVGRHAGGGLGLEMFTDVAAPTRQFLLHVPERESTESRSHALNFATLANGATVLGLPTAAVDASRQQWERGDPQPSDLEFFALNGPRLAPLGRIELHEQTPPACAQSCYDWYGSARVFFVGNRIFALSGVAMAEGRLGPRGVETLRRVDLAPAP